MTETPPPSGKKKTRGFKISAPIAIVIVLLAGAQLYFVNGWDGIISRLLSGIKAPTTSWAFDAEKCWLSVENESGHRLVFAPQGLNLLPVTEGVNLLRMAGPGGAPEITLPGTSSEGRFYTSAYKSPFGGSVMPQIFADGDSFTVTASTEEEAETITFPSFDLELPKTKEAQLMRARFAACKLF